MAALGRGQAAQAALRHPALLLAQATSSTAVVMVDPTGEPPAAAAVLEVLAATGPPVGRAALAPMVALAVVPAPIPEAPAAAAMHQAPAPEQTEVSTPQAGLGVLVSEHRPTVCRAATARKVVVVAVASEARHLPAATVATVSCGAPILVPEAEAVLALVQARRCRLAGMVVAGAAAAVVVVRPVRQLARRSRAAERRAPY